MAFKKFIALASLLVLLESIEANPCAGIQQGFVNDYSDCSRYFSCWQGNAQSVTCPDNRIFMLEPLGCHNPGPGVTCERCPASGVFNFPVAGSCTKFIMCINSIDTPRECAPGTRFDPREGRCNLRELVPCPYNTCPDTGSSLIPDPDSCEHYFVCLNGDPVARRQCAEDLRFDPDLSTCARAENVICGARRTFARLPTVPAVVPTAPTGHPTSKVPTAPTARPPPK